MQITDVDIKNTVLELFARRGLVHGDVMWLSRLEKFWGRNPVAPVLTWSRPSRCSVLNN
jgi:hypothetical protein